MPTGKVDRRSAQAVAEAYLRTVWSWDTAVDDSPDGASRRAARYAVDPLRTSLLAGGSRGVGSAFAAAEAAGGGYAVVTSVYAIEGAEPAARGDETTVALEVVIEVRDGAGRTLPGASSAISNLTLTRDGSGRWSVSRDEAA